MERHLYLPPPTFLWKIPNTEVALTRGNPYMKIDGTEFDHLLDHQKEESETILRRGIAAGTVVLLNESFIPTDQEKMDVHYILALPADTIQRKFVARMDRVENIPMIESLINEEAKGKTPRQGLLNLLKTKIEIINLAAEQKKGNRNLEEQFFDQIQSDDENILLDFKAPKAARK